MAVSSAPLLVSASWLKDNLNKPGIKVLDGTWHVPMWKRDAEAEYLSQHIEGALRFSVNDVVDKTAPLPFTLPPTEQFEEYAGKLGISSTDHVIVYDNNSNFGMFSAPRVWYTFKLYGHDKVSVLNGGLPKWLEEGGPVQSGPQPQVETATYKGTYHPEIIATFEQYLEAYNNKSAKFLDARPVGRYEGRDPEPNPKIHSGHVKGSASLFWPRFINPETKTVKSTDEIIKVFSEVGVNIHEDKCIASCLSGISSTWIMFAAQHVDKIIPVYTGSWLEWYQRGPEDSKVLGVKGEDLK